MLVKRFERGAAVGKTNIEHRTSNDERRSKKEGKSAATALHFNVRSSMFDVRRSHFRLHISAPKTATPILPYLRKHLKCAHAILNPPLVELSLALVADKKMSDLHLRFMGLPGPTDVMTFPLEINTKGQSLSGEVVICVPEARRRCKDHGKDLRQELLLYALHGLLHLCGFDDRTDRDFRRMHRMEDLILTQLGVGPVFAGPPSPPVPRR